ncbi:hypothetical protein HMPREF3136_09005 [Neisseria sp. HMSC15C08]|nr:hypothetical protein HMPREF3136_09005 [Neisseria sp. HMSC15C08]
MIIDSLLELSIEQAVTTSAASTNVVDFSTKKPNTGNAAHNLYAVFTIPESFAGGSLTISLQDSADGTNFANVISGVTATDLKAGSQYVIPMPVSHRRYIRAYYAVTGSMTAGKINCAIVSGLQNNEPAPESQKVWSGKK